MLCSPQHLLIAACSLSPLPSPRRVPEALLCASDADDSAVEELGGDDHSGLLIRRLLTQRSVQTQLKYQMEFKNGFAQQWLTRFTTEQGAAPLVVGSPARGQQKVLHCHHAMRRVEWDRYMLDMLSAPEETHVVSVMRGGGSPGRRLSKGNPYLKKVQQQQQQPWRTYSDTVRPGQLARQILQIREHIAAEWVRDLTLIERENDELRRHRKEEVVNVVDELERFQHAIRPEDDLSNDDDDEGKGGSTPLRQASYDLLRNALTAEAIRLLVVRLGDDASTQHSSNWLRGFAAEHASDILPSPSKTERCVEWHRARIVLREMMREPVSMSKSPGGEARFNDPLALAERAMRLRSKVAREWIDACAAAPDEHLKLQRDRLNMRITADEPLFVPKSLEGSYQMLDDPEMNA